jgi:ABC-type hemin transport system substrate-binding protein
MIGVVLAFCIVAGCGEGATSEPAPSTENTGPRLVTLAPALTQMIVDLGMQDAIVGVAEYETAVPPGPPVVGNFAAVNTEMLLSTKPTHVLTMAGPSGPPPRLRELAMQGLFELHSFPFPLSLKDIGNVLFDEDPAPGSGPSLGEVLGKPGSAVALKLLLYKQLASIEAVTASRDKPTVLMVLGIGPVMASGPGTVHDELLGFAGAINAAGDAAVTAPEFGREALLAMSPQVILFLQPEAPPIRQDDARLAFFAGLPIPAIENNRVYVINDPLVLLPSSSIGRICAAMAKVIHPDLAGEIDRALAEETGEDVE